MKSCYLILFIPLNLQAISFPLLTGLLRYEMNKRGVTFPALEAPSMQEFKQMLCELYTALIEEDRTNVEERCEALLKQWGSDPNKRLLIKRAYRDFFSINPIV